MSDRNSQGNDGMITQILHLIEAKLGSPLKCKQPHIRFQSSLAKQEEFFFENLQVCEATPKRHRTANREFHGTNPQSRGEGN